MAFPCPLRLGGEVSVELPDPSHLADIFPFKRGRPTVDSNNTTSHEMAYTGSVLYLFVEKQPKSCPTRRKEPYFSLNSIYYNTSVGVKQWILSGVGVDK